MARVVVLDAGPFGLVSGPGVRPTSARCQRWARSLLAAGVRVVVPEVADYEVRRELIRRGATAGLVRLDRVVAGLDFAPITRDAMLLAAELWARARRGGYPMAGPDALDADCILAAQALTIVLPGDTLVVATTNPGHLGRFLDARTWDQIIP
jgi:predicted nucleic acid-binding protein